MMGLLMNVFCEQTRVVLSAEHPHSLLEMLVVEIQLAVAVYDRPTPHQGQCYFALDWLQIHDFLCQKYFCNMRKQNIVDAQMYMYE